MIARTKSLVLASDVEEKLQIYIELFGSSTRDRHARHIYWRMFRE